MLFIAGLDGRILLGSDALHRALGPVGEQGRALRDLVHEEDRAAFEAMWTRLGEGLSPAQVAGRFRDAEGAWRRLSCQAARAEDGSAIHGSLRAIEGPALKEQIIDAMADCLPLCIWAIDEEGVFLYHDGAGTEGVGVRRGQYLGQNVFTLYAGVAGADVNVRKALAGEPQHYIDKSHNNYWENWIVPGRDPVSDKPRVFGFTLDITQTGRAQEELRLRLEQIEQQREVIRALSTPIIEVWDGVLTLPLVGVIDSARTAEVMDTLLQSVAEKQARFAILDLTGVEVVDSRVAGYLAELARALRLLGAEGVIAGIKPTVAQTMVNLGLDLSQVVTQRNLRAALSYCMRRA